MAQPEAELLGQRLARSVPAKLPATLDITDVGATFSLAPIDDKLSSSTMIRSLASMIRSVTATTQITETMIHDPRANDSVSRSNDHSSQLNDRRTFGNRSSPRRRDRKADSFSQRVISMALWLVTMTLGVKTLVLRAIPIARGIKTVPARVITLGERDNNVDSASENEPEARQNDGPARDDEACAR